LELEKVGLRLNKPKPNISITPNKFGGIRYNGHSKCKIDDK
jgi:ribosome-interacting GTPase 1